MRSRMRASGSPHTSPSSTRPSRHRQYWCEVEPREATPRIVAALPRVRAIWGGKALAITGLILALHGCSLDTRPLKDSQGSSTHIATVDADSPNVESESMKAVTSQVPNDAVVPTVTMEPTVPATQPAVPTLSDAGSAATEDVAISEPISGAAGQDSSPMEPMQDAPAPSEPSSTPDMDSMMEAMATPDSQPPETTTNDEPDPDAADPAATDAADQFAMLMSWLEQLAQLNPQLRQQQAYARLTEAVLGGPTVANLTEALRALEEIGCRRAGDTCQGVCQWVRFNCDTCQTDPACLTALTEVCLVRCR